MSPLQYLTVKNGRRVLTSDGAADPHFQYAAGRPRLVRGRADTDPLALIYLNGRLIPIGLLYVPGSGGAKVRERNPANITWEGPLVIPSNQTPNQTDGSYLVQNRSFRNTSPTGAPAILNHSNLMVKIWDCNVMGFGGDGANLNLICADAMNSRMDIRNTIGFSGNPGVDGGFAGRFLSMQYWAFCSVVGCEMNGTTGVALIGFTGSHTQQTLIFKFNKIKNLDGRMSAGPGIYRQTNNRLPDVNPGFVVANVLQLNNSMGVIGEIAYNECVNEAGASRFEDLYAFHTSSGVSRAQPLWLHHNFGWGSYVYDYAFRPGMSWYGNNMPLGVPGRTNDNRGFVQSGGMGLLGDGKAGNAADTSYDPAYVLAEDNVMLDSSNYGMGIAAGHDHILRRNLILRSGYVHNFPDDVKVAWVNNALQVQDYATGNGYNYPTASDPIRWYGHEITDNTYSCTYFDARNNGAQGTVPFTIDGTIVSPASYISSNNVNLGVVTRAQVNQAALDWQAARAAQGMQIGAA